MVISFTSVQHNPFQLGTLNSPGVGLDERSLPIPTILSCCESKFPSLPLINWEKIITQNTIMNNGVRTVNLLCPNSCLNELSLILWTTPPNWTKFQNINIYSLSEKIRSIDLTEVIRSNPPIQASVELQHGCKLSSLTCRQALQSSHGFSTSVKHRWATPETKHQFLPTVGKGSITKHLQNSSHCAEAQLLVPCLLVA